MMKKVALSAAAALSMGLPATASFAGDAAAGEAAFRGCRSCHGIVDADGTTIQRGGRSGPNLYGVAGSAVATVEGFRYSDPIIQYAATGATWTEEVFVSYVTDPTAHLRAALEDDSVRSGMNYRLRSGAEDMYAYLVSVAPAEATEATE